MKKPCGGYTLVEIMIVLAVTGMIAVSAFWAVSGQQARTEFTQAVRDFDSKLQDVANDVSHGYYPFVNDQAQCRKVGGRPQFTGGAGGEQGASDECVFIGKVIQFEPAGEDGVMRIYTIAGKRANEGRPVRSLLESQTVVAQTPSESINLTEFHTILWDMQVVRVNVIGGPSGIGTIAFMTNFGGNSGSHPYTRLYYLCGSTLNQLVSELITLGGEPECRGRLNNRQSYIPNSSGIEICLERSNRFAKVTVGGSGSQLTTHVEILQGADRCDT